MNFDLDVNNYNKNELQEIFNLQPGYDINALTESEKKLKDGIQSEKSIDPSVKQQTIQFISNARRMLMNDLNNPKSANSVNDGFDVIDPSFTSILTSSTSSLGYLENHPDAYFPKPINPPLTTRTITLSVNTVYRDNYYATQSSDFILNLPMRLTSVMSMSIGAIEFPSTTFNNISSIFQNNFFWIRAGTVENNDVENQLITLPVGNYTTSVVISYINSFLQTLTTTTYLQYIYFTVNITSDSNIGTGQLIVGVKSSYPYPNNPFPFELDFQAALDGSPDYYTPLPIKLGWALGFRVGIYINNSSYISEGNVNFGGPFYAYLVVEDFNNSYDSTFIAFNSSIKSSNILARLGFQNTNPALTTNANVSSSSAPRNYPGPVTIEKLGIKVMDEFGRILNFNSMDFSFSLSFTLGTNGPKA